ncbi:HAD-IA family hydrolase [Paenibacillus eucommiae]|uniref:Phosphoglycolate phosphatase n=1 Tax=Paenibacillus eucommiae TaxID=1355755 RepID=A0ABS4IT76_9BACL|nr:HAD-IA family hydrolase [Paenibacillus eucommiae]MBP1989804.1 phosphoglycolate phosphatase [Paenibacillus eucommiae]
MNILWDFDGTLFNTYPAYVEIIKEFIHEVVSEEELLSHLKISFSHTAQHYKLTENQVKEILDRERMLHPAQTPPFPFVEEVLKFAHINVIMTHKPRGEVLDILRHYEWENYFLDIVAGDDGYPRKPDPASYIFLHNKHRIDLAIGDREIDILPAKSMGIKTCLFQNTTPGADLYVSDYKEFFKTKGIDM